MPNPKCRKYLDPFLCLILLRSAHLYNTEESIKLLPPCHPSLRSVCKGQEERACCAALFLLLYSAKLCLASRPRMKVEMRRFNFLYCFSSLTQLHSASPPFASFVTFSYIKSQLHKTCILSFFSCLYLLSVFWVLQTNILSSFFVLFFFGTSNPSEKLFASLRNIKYPLDFLNTYSH